MKTEEHARQNVAKDFCLKNAIPSEWSLMTVVVKPYMFI
jgi:hypothetical protein